MHRTSLIKALTRYKVGPFFTPEEDVAYDSLLSFVRENHDCFERDHAGHVTGSAWLVNHDLTAVLLTHHKKLGKWLQLGGHADGDPSIDQVAFKEACEESGIEGIDFIMAEIFDIDVHSIPGKCVTHYDIRYLLKAPLNDRYRASEESNDLAWVRFEDMPLYSQESSLQRMAGKMKIVKQTTWSVRPIRIEQTSLD